MQTQKIAILGAAESGVGTALLAKQQGFAIWVSDRGCIAEKYKKILREEAIQFEEGAHSQLEILNADLVMKSPGIAESTPIMKAVRVAGIPVRHRA